MPEGNERMRCPVCRRPAREAANPFCSPSCRAVFRETRRRSYAEPAGPLPSDLASALCATLSDQSADAERGLTP
jgi:hypothetical protein